MVFIGELRIEGEDAGDASAVGDADNTIIVSRSGKLAGAARSRRVILNGRVRGSVPCARSVAMLEPA